MAPRFIPYTPSVEVAEPQFDENLQTVIDKSERYIAESVTAEGTGRAVRDEHAKGYGVVGGEVEILGGLPAEYAQGIYATPGRHDALIRFSNGSPHAGADARLGSATGLALKIFDTVRLCWRTSLTRLCAICRTRSVHGSGVGASCAETTPEPAMKS